ncbi:nucleoside triphosphate pyrophosphatase [Aestuariibacter sp. A3R04]|uniref:Maf family protein n=1 Tax=Aestuariibacter sp. A3R04 TaxID=2841571 RepID=UPI001C0866B5|nr:nucleoside triphosphate pyrophosphatase [Aestuariibacter sp. A3R04]MBU3022714.1 septum formation protein Maf [Aestuariibacter sp. A3R04]
MTTVSTPPFILASSSRYRQAQMTALGVETCCIAPYIDETPMDGEAPDKLAARLAAEKAKTVAAVHREALVIGSDQVACVSDGQGRTVILGKPHHYDAAAKQLALCSGKRVVFHTALSVVKYNEQKEITGMDNTTVHFLPLTSQDISRYLRSETPYDCAGSFKSEGKGVLLFDRIDSRDPQALIGLPVMLLRDILKEFDVDLLALATSSR